MGPGDLDVSWTIQPQVADRQEITGPEIVPAQGQGLLEGPDGLRQLPPPLQIVPQQEVSRAAGWAGRPPPVAFACGRRPRGPAPGGSGPAAGDRRGWGVPVGSPGRAAAGLRPGAGAGCPRRPPRPGPATARNSRGELVCLLRRVRASVADRGSWMAIGDRRSANGTRPRRLPGGLAGSPSGWRAGRRPVNPEPWNRASSRAAKNCRYFSSARRRVSWLRQPAIGRLEPGDGPGFPGQ